MLVFLSTNLLVLESRNLWLNLRWSTHNVNLSMDFAHVHSNNVMIDSKDAKAKVQADVSPVQKPGKTWRKIILPDHDWSALAHNSVTPMTHLFMETELSVEELTEEERHYTMLKEVVQQLYLLIYRTLNQKPFTERLMKFFYFWQILHWTNIFVILKQEKLSNISFLLSTMVCQKHHHIRR